MLVCISMLCRCLSWYPLWLLLLAADSQAPVLPVCGILFGGSLLCSTCVRLLRLRLSSRKRLAFWLSGIFTVIAAAVCAAGCIAAGSAMFPGIISAAVTFIGTGIHAEAADERLYPLNAYVAFLTFSAAATVMLRMADQNDCLPLTLGIIGIISALFLILRNQLMLLRFVRRRSSTEAAVPKDIRRGNMLLVCGIILLLVCVFLFHEPLVGLLFLLQRALVRLVFAVITAVIHILKYLSGDTPSGAELEEVSEHAMEKLTGGKHSPLWLLLWIPYIAVAGFIWHEFLSDWVYDIRMLLHDLAARLRKSGENGTFLRHTDTDDYYDTETTLRRDRKRSSKQKQWRRALRKWNAMPDGSEKFYAGYRLLLEAPCWTADILHAADTVREIREKWSAYYTPPAALDAVTDDFHADRYAEKGLPAEAIADLSAALTCIRNARKTQE